MLPGMARVNGTGLWDGLGRRLMGAALAGAVLCPSLAQAGPWTKGPGEGYVKAEAGAFTSDRYVDARGNPVEGAHYLALTLSTYFEWGLAEGLHVQGYVPLQSATQRFDDGREGGTFGLSDTRLAVQYGPKILPLPIAARLEVKLAPYAVSNTVEDPSLGDGQMDLTLWITAGAGSGDPPVYGYLEIGYQHRTEIFFGPDPGTAPGDGLALFGQAGWTFFERLVVALNVGGVVPFADDTVTKGYLTVGPSIFFAVDEHFALEANFNPVVWARNSASGFSVGAGISYRQ